MKFGEKIKLLRKEKGLSQEDLGKKIGGDAKQISLYENGKMSPSADGIKKLALALDISTDYLLFEEADKKPLTLEKDEFVQRINEIQKFSIQDKDALITIIDGLIVKNKFQALAK